MNFVEFTAYDRLSEERFKIAINPESVLSVESYEIHPQGEFYKMWTRIFSTSYPTGIIITDNFDSVCKKLNE